MFRFRKIFTSFAAKFQPSMTQSANRQEHLDFLKAVFIVLMVAFHLVYFSQGYPYIKQIVYTFHMPAFLLISGYLSKSNKSPKAFATSIFWLTIPSGHGKRLRADGLYPTHQRSCGKSEYGAFLAKNFHRSAGAVLVSAHTDYL